MVWRSTTGPRAVALSCVTAHQAAGLLLGLRACPLSRARQRLQTLADGNDQAKELAGNDAGLRALCCDGGWNGQGEENDAGPRDGGFCWDGVGDFVAYARCCYGDVASLARPASPPEWIMHELTSDLEPWNHNGSRKGGPRLLQTSGPDMQAMRSRWGHIYCRFAVEGRVLRTCDPRSIEVLQDSNTSELYGQYESLAFATRVLLAIGLLPDSFEFYMSPHLFEHHELDVAVPVLTKARAVFSRGFVRVPSYELMSPLLDRTRRQLPDVDWEDKQPVLFWRGGMRSFNSCPCSSGLIWPRLWREFDFTCLLAQKHVLPGTCADLPATLCALPDGAARCRCHRHVTNSTTFNWSNRVRLCELSQRHPDLIDARLTYVPELTYAPILDSVESHGYLDSFARIADQAHFRYLMSTDGSTIDDTRIYWMLSTGSVVFKQVTPLLPFGIPGLEPWTHFIPVREDLADLPAKVRWARRHDDECRTMAERAKGVATERFTQQHIFHYVYRALDAVLDVSRVSRLRTSATVG